MNQHARSVAVDAKSAVGHTEQEMLRLELLDALRIARLNRSARRLIEELGIQQPEFTQPDRICDTISFLGETGACLKTDLQAATVAARNNGTTAAQEIIASGALSPDQFADELRHYTACAPIDARNVKAILGADSDPTLLANDRAVRWCRMDDDRIVPVVTSLPSLIDRQKRISNSIELQRRLRIIDQPNAHRLVIAKRGSDICKNVSEALWSESPTFSAKSQATFTQGVQLSVMLLCLVWAFGAATTTIGLALHLGFTLFFLSCTLLRVAATCARPADRDADVISSEDASKPVWTVLVALYHERETIPGLIQHLGALKWPRAKIEIKLVCEADDIGTVGAIEACQPDHRFEIIRVPDVGPRTKPKALCFAIPFTTGSFVTLYDAEDRPAPMQLEEAWQRFDTADDKLACLQSPLKIANGHRNKLTALFELEYAGLFGRLLPWLAAMRCPIPLGGTSNHFKRTALTEVGGWDPYNVTEDADLGYRLFGAGYRTETLSLPTLEDAPKQFGIWLPQRTRWFKGWMQTWLVHSRNPMSFIQRFGLFRFLVHQCVMSGVIMSTLIHPLIIFNIVWLWSWVASQTDHATPLLIATDSLTIIISYLAFSVLGLSAVEPKKRRHLRRALCFVPFYWMAMSFAAWRALLQCFRQPFVWEKTPHMAYDTD